jgi:signal transduction histidine kinase/ligand-binding sensor domain-containing protein
MRIACIPACWFLALLVSVRPASALDPRTRITQYFHTAWRVQDGAFEAAPNAVTQTADGYIWIGTGSGLVKYDGARFEAWATPPGKSLTNPNVISLLGSSDGTLWIGTARGLLSWKSNELREHLKYRINGIIEDRKGRIWAAQGRSNQTGGLCRVTGEQPGCFGADDQMRLPNAATLAADLHGNIWVGTSNRLLRWHDGSFESYFSERLALRGQTNGVESIAAAADGSVWVSIPSEKSLSLLHILDGRPKPVILEGVKKQKFTNLFLDRGGALWLATSDVGIYRYYNGQVGHFGSEDGLSSNTVSGFFEDREGNLWVTTSKGLDFFRDNRVVTFSTSEGLSSDLAGPVLASDDGTVWIGNRGGLDVIRIGKVTSIPIPGQRVTALWQDHARRIWIGIDKSLAIYERGQFRKVNRPDGSPLGMITAIGEDREQNIWAVANPDRKLYRIRDLRVQEEFSPPRISNPRLVTEDPSGGVWLGFTGAFGHYRDGKLDLLGQNSAVSLTAEVDGSLWSPTRTGLVRWKDGRTETLTSKNGLKCNAIYAAIRDDHRTLWLYTQCGLVGIADSELERWWRNPGSVIQNRVFDALDGATPYSSTFQPGASKSPDGRLWFVNDSVVQMFDPARSSQQRPAPPVYVERVHADRREYALNGSVRVAPRPRDIEISYTALSYFIPQRVRFRYKLEPRDRDWQDAGTRRQAFYSDLPPGRYRFQVTASNSDSVWNETGAAVEFSILPAWFENTWFRLSVIAVGLLSLWMLYRLRLRRLARELNAHFEGQADERLRVARELHDTLLQSFQGLIPVFQTARNLLPGRADQAAEVLEDGLKDAASAIVEGRNAIQNLRANPGIEHDLDALLTAVGRELAASPKKEGCAPAFRVIVEGSRQQLAPMVQDEVYRIGREMLRNAFRHAQAGLIEAEIRYDDSLFRLRVRDNGKGFDSKILKQSTGGGHWGLPGVHERAKRIGGRFTIWSESGAGTEAELTVPAGVAFAKFSNSNGRWAMLVRRLGLVAPNRKA